MASPQIEQFWRDLVSDIRSNRVELPALPDIAVRARRLLDSHTATDRQIARLIGADAVLSTRLLRVANSPLYRATRKIEDVKSAVTRLGHAAVRSVVTSIAMEQLYHHKLASPLKRRFLEQTWNHSVHVAALSHVIARDYTGFQPDQALLGGLIHDIGKLPILEYAELLPELMENEKLLARLLAALHTKVGTLILRTWQFTDDLVTVTAEHEDLDRDPGTDADLTDVVIIANLLSYVGTDHPLTKRDWSAIPAFHRLALTPEESIDIIRDARDEIAEIRQLFRS